MAISSNPRQHIGRKLCIVCREFRSATRRRHPAYKKDDLRNEELRPSLRKAFREAAHTKDAPETRWKILQTMRSATRLVAAARRAAPECNLVLQTSAERSAGSVFRNGPNIIRTLPAPVQTTPPELSFYRARFGSQHLGPQGPYEDDLIRLSGLQARIPGGQSNHDNATLSKPFSRIESEGC